MADPKSGMAQKPVDDIGIGTTRDGVSVVTPEQHARAAMERNAEEAIEGEMPEDFSDLLSGAD